MCLTIERSWPFRVSSFKRLFVSRICYLVNVEDVEDDAGGRRMLLMRSAPWDSMTLQV